MKQKTGKNKLKTISDKKFVMVQLVDGNPSQIQQLVNFLTEKSSDDFEFIVTNQVIEWNTINYMIESLSHARDEDLKKLKKAGVKGEKND